MTGTGVHRGVRVPNLAGLAFIGGAAVIAGVRYRRRKGPLSSVDTSPGHHTLV